MSARGGKRTLARACTAKEAAILDADEAAGHEEARMEEEELRLAWLEMLEERSRG